MNKKMICIKAYNAHCLTQGNIYIITNIKYSPNDDSYYQCVNDNGDLEWFFKTRFEKCKLELSSNIKIL